MANKLTVKLDGRDYTIVSEESREYMLEISDIVNSWRIVHTNLRLCGVDKPGIERMRWRVPTYQLRSFR